jgi:DnaJ-class molecular chaperone
MKQGKIGTRKTITCPSCDGTGKVLNEELLASDNITTDKDCMDCGGTGKVEGIIVQQ